MAIGQGEWKPMSLIAQSRQVLSDRVEQATRVFSLLGVTIFTALSAIIVVNIILTSVFSTPFQDTEEIARTLLPVGIAACFPAALWQGRHITIRFLGNLLSEKISRVLEVFGACATLLFLTLVFWQLSVYTGELRAVGEHTWTLEWPLAPFWWFATAFMGLCIPIQIMIILNAVNRIWRPE